MRAHTESLLVSLLSAAVLVGVASAHGGMYRAPGDVIPPPATGGSGGGSTAPASPTGAGPGAGGAVGGSAASNPATGGSLAPAGAAPATRGVAIGFDATRWQFWWEFHKDPYLRLKEAVHRDALPPGSDEIWFGRSRRPRAHDTLRPTHREVVDKVLPALRRALDGTEQRDIVSSCLVAIAKIGTDHPDFAILPLLRDHLRSHDQEIRETAALAMGISQKPEAIPDLIGLAQDDAHGRALVGRSEVDVRTRSFSIYGLGLIADASRSLDVRDRILGVVRKLLHPEEHVRHDLRVAAIHAVRLLAPGHAASPAARALRLACVSVLDDYYAGATAPGEQRLRAHVPPAIAEVLGRDDPAAGAYRERFARLLTRPGAQHNLVQSAAIALGGLIRPEHAAASGDDARHVDALASYFRSGRDQQARYFALVSIAEVGGARARDELLRAFREARHLDRTWAALALGLWSFHARERAETVGTEIGKALRAELARAREPELRGALAIGLGLARVEDAEDDLLELLGRYRHQDELAGYLCVGLALMRSERGIDTIRDVAQTSVRRPELMRQAAIALGKLGDKNVADMLTRQLQAPNRNVARLGAVSAALGLIGDRRTIEPLIALLFDDQVTDLSRAFAAVALGGVADKEALPWNSKIAVGMNYRAQVETLTDGLSGILDIL